jgi:hypothetical protein
MRLLVLTLAFSLLSFTADARPRKRARHAPPAAVPTKSDRSPSASERNAQDYARAEAELADLRAGRVSREESQAEAPAQNSAVQENDAEVPAPLRQKKR